MKMTDKEENMGNGTASEGNARVFFQEIRELQRETAREMREQSRAWDKRFAETTREIRERSRELDKRFAETDRQMKETDRQLKETDRRLKETARQMKETDKKIGLLGNRLGEFVEEMVKPGVVRLFQERGMAVRACIGPIEVSDDAGGIEVDLVVKNTTEMLIVECKSKLSVDDVNVHVQRIEKFRHYFPEYADKQLLGVVAAMVVPRDVSKYAYRQGLFVLAQSGEMMKILNDTAFTPRVW